MPQSEMLQSIATQSIVNSTMRGIFLLILLSRLRVGPAGAAYADSAVSNTHHGLNNDAHGIAADQVMNEIMSHQLSTRSLLTRSSPECWRASFAAINRWTIGDGDVHSSGSSYCASMTNDQQEVLALELTNCQLMKEKRHFYDANLMNHELADSTEVSGCSVGSGGMNPYDASSCLPIMSEYALSLYHKILLHTNDICTRLTDEKLMQQKEEVTQMLIYASSAVSQQMQSVMTLSTTAVEKMQMQSALLDDQSIMMREQREEIQRMHLARKKEEREIRNQHMESDRLQKAREQVAALAMEQITNQTSSFLQEHAENMKSRQSELDVALQNREKEAERMQAETTALISEQADRIKDQKRDLERMQEMITSANSQMKPLTSIESYVRLATDGFTVLKSLLNFFLSMNIAWMVTAMPLLCRSRRYLFGAFALGLVAEITVIWFTDNALIMDNEEMDNIEIVRDWTRVAAIVALLLSSLVSCFLPAKKEAMDELLRIQMDLVSKLNASAPIEARDERIEAPRVQEVSNIEAPDSDTHHSKPVTVKFREERGRSRERMRPEDSFIISNRNFKPRRRRSRSPYRSSLTELAMPVVTPMKPRRPKSNVAATAAPPRSQVNRQSNTYYAHRSDAIANQEEEAHRLKLECLRALQKRSGEETSSDESSIECSSVNSNKKKRKVSDMYASSGEESNFVSANDEEMSDSTIPFVTSPSRNQEKKRCKLTNEQAS